MAEIVSQEALTIKLQFLTTKTGGDAYIDDSHAARYEKGIGGVQVGLIRSVAKLFPQNLRQEEC
jgi:hypothetical protein